MCADAFPQPSSARQSSAKQLERLRVAVTGATGGIGRALVATLTEGGVTVAATGSAPERLAALRSAHPQVFVHRADITREEDVAGFFAAAGAELGPLDAVVNLAGLSVPGQVTETDEEVFRRVMSVNVLGTFLACKHALPLLGPGGLIVNVGSAAAHRANPNAPLYCSAKAAVAMFSDALALQLKENGIRVANLSPGGVDTPFWGDRPVDRSRLLHAQDVADALVFLLTRPPHVEVRDLRFQAFPSS